MNCVTNYTLTYTFTLATDATYLLCRTYGRASPAQFDVKDTTVVDRSFEHPSNRNYCAAFSRQAEKNDLFGELS